MTTDFAAPVKEVGARLPRPLLPRFQPLRAGIVNLWQYDDQELAFHQGRLILRGENGSGKSKALELLLPFLLDADLSPQRLDPFGGTSRTMEWNLLQDGRYESRVGYVWLELGRRAGTAETPDAADVCWTLGCGLRASQRTRRVDSWYFLTHRRIGGDLALVSPSRTPLLKDQLRQEIGADGWVFDTGKDYREKLDQHLFGLGDDRFSSLRHLLLQLRRPHLSEKLDPRTLAELLKESLPPLDANRIGELSEGFERLEKDQQDLARAQAAADGVGSFLHLYREFARGLGRGRAGEVRQSDSRYHKTAGEVRDAEAEEARLADQLVTLTARERQAETEIDEIDAAIAVLAASPAMRTAAVLRVRGEQADMLERAAAESEALAQRQGQTVSGLRHDAEVAVQEAARAVRLCEDGAAAAAAAARAVGLTAAWEAASAAVADRPAAARAMVDSSVRQRQDGIDELRRLGEERDRARSLEERAEEQLREADAQLRAAARRGREAEGEVEAERRALDSALIAWWQSLVELRLEASDLEVLRAGGATADGGGLEAAIVAAARPRRDSLIAERSSLSVDRARVAAAKAAGEEERRRVAAARELGPEPPPRRAADRAGRVGAPLYLLCDFAPRVGEAARASLEASLEAAGLLDAWVMPDGNVLAADTLDTFLVPDPASEPVVGPSLADLMVPVPGHGVGADVLTALLRRVAIDGAAGLDGDGADGVDAAGTLGRAASAVGGGGSFRLGLLRGAASKAVAEHVGAGARAAARERRLRELAEHIAALDRELAGLESRDESLRDRLAVVDRELAAAPRTVSLLHALARAAAALADETRRGEERTAAAVRAVAAHAAHDAAQGRLTGRARDLGLSGHLDRLEGYAEDLRRFAARFQALATLVPAAGQAGERATRAARKLEEGQAWESRARRRAEETSSAAVLSRAEHAELEKTVGAEAREVVERHRVQSARREELVARRKSLADEVQSQALLHARTQERLALKQADLQEREADRVRVTGRLHRFAAGGLLSLALAAPPDDTAAAWSLTRTLDIARDIERECGDVDLSAQAASRRANRLYERFRLLEADLGADYQPSLEQDEDLVVVRVAYNGREHGVGSLLDVLREGVEVRRALLAEHERELLRRFLLDEVGGHLRDRLQRARALVASMNEVLESCRTASGMSLKLAWEAAPEAPDAVRDVVRLLQRDLEILPDAERRRIETFFLARIEEARQQWETVPWREHLLAALDYRSWFTFRILRRSAGDGDWVELTRRGHAASSGGEKAVALHLPLFAAAAAHYRSALPSAPRLILLDEAFAGIDQSMRGRCMGLLVALDLDFLMTSHDEWGCYEELPGVAIVHLYRDPGMDGVVAVSFVWNGQSLGEVEAAERPPR
jgi:uncharacterized protein (TIGR02680 family)